VLNAAAAITTSATMITAIMIAMRIVADAMIDSAATKAPGRGRAR
jgi:hypothetical protein